MAENEPLFPDRFEVDRDATSPIIGRRDPQGCKVTRTGRIKVNTAGSEAIRELIARAGFEEITQCGMLLATDVQAQEIGGRPVPPDTRGATPIRIEPRKGTLVLYAGNLYKKYPKLLRPASDAWVSISFPEGGYFIIHLKLMLNRPTRRQGPRKKAVGGQEPSAGQSGADAAAGEEKSEDAGNE